ncbi:MAG: DNA mismatch repair endonuclease MutL [Haloferacaceae archaeon]
MTAEPDGAVRRLDDETRRKIAAGEIVARPADVVVELVENALDAGADRIDVGVWGDGTERIRVADDGSGMAREDAALAVERHTTSKLRGPDEVERVRTLGFRGEALPSIAAAGTLELTTSDGGAEGTRVVVDGGEAGGDGGANRDAGSSGDGGPSDDAGPSGDAGSTGGPTVSAVGRARGTTVEVRNLFAERPARRKSLASPAAEFQRVSDAVARRALVHPEVAFTLAHDDARTFATAGTGDYTDAVLGVYDREVARESTTFEHETSLDADGIPGGDGNGNGDGDGDGDDWNVDGDADDWNSDADADPLVRVEGLLAYPSTTRATREHVYAAVDGRPVANDVVRRAVVDGYGTLLPSGRYPIAVVDVSLPPGFVDVNVDPAKRDVAFRDDAAVADAVETAVSEALTTADLRRSGEVAMDLERSLAPVEGDSPFDGVRVIGQFRDAYLLCEADDDLLVVDQHAAHERVNFERLRAALEGEAVPRADRSPPETLSLSPAEVAAVEAHADELARLGFDVAPFGGGTVRLRAVPAPLGRTADADALREVLDALRSGDSPADRREELLKDLACHPSLKAGDALDGEDAAALLDRLGACEQPFACPHGRPTVLSIEEATLVRGFEREHARLG